jgi:hypothetical protein
MRGPFIARCAITAGRKQYNEQHEKRKKTGSGSDFTGKARMEYHEEPP